MVGARSWPSEEIFVIIAIVSLLASLSILLFRPMSPNLDKRVLVAVVAADTLLLLLLIVINAVLASGQRSPLRWLVLFSHLELRQRCTLSLADPIDGRAHTA